MASIILIIIVLIILVSLAGLIQLILFPSTKFILKKLHKDIPLTASRLKKIKYLTLTVSIIISFITTSYYAFTNPTKNYKQAIIYNQQENFKILIIGKRKYMVHDPTSLLSNETYDDTLVLYVPRREGIIESKEILNEEGWPLPVVGKIIIVKNKMTVEMYRNGNSATKKEFSWNGEY